MLMISAAGLTSAQVGDMYSLNVRMADCEFGQKDTIFKFNEKELTKTVSAEVFRSWQSAGIPDHIVLKSAADTRRVRFVVLDVSSGLTGAIDVPVNPSEIAKSAPPVPKMAIEEARKIRETVGSHPDGSRDAAPPAGGIG